MKNELLKRIISSIILIPLAFFFIIKGNLYFTFFLLICFSISMYEWYKISKNQKYFIFGILFLFFSFFSIFQIRTFEDNDPTYLFLVLVICILSDIGGYLFGKILKGPKLTKLSPNKTFSGMFGGYFIAIFSLILINNYINFLISDSIIFNIIFIFIISSISQIGDISISYFKRLSNIKDTGNVIPGHGGILDRIDGMIFAFPMSYLIYLLFLK